MSLAPIIATAVNGGLYLIRKHGAQVLLSDASSQVAVLKSQHAYVFLLITYLVLPPVSMIHFQSLGNYYCLHLFCSLIDGDIQLIVSLYCTDCMTLGDGSSYLRSDTSVSCDAPSYAVFATFVSFFLLIYQGLPVFPFCRFISLELLS